MLTWLGYKFRVATGIGRLVENVNVRTWGLEEGSWVSQTQWVAATLLVWGPANPFSSCLGLLDYCSVLTDGIDCLLSHTTVLWKDQGSDEPTPHEVMIVLRGWTNWLSAAVDVCFTECRFRHKCKRPLDSWNLSSSYVRLCCVCRKR